MLCERKNCTKLSQGSQQNKVLTICRSYKLYYKSHGVNWPLIDFYLVWHSLLKSLASVNDNWRVINTTVTEGSKHFLFGGGGGEGVTSAYNKQGCVMLTRKIVSKNLGNYLKLKPKSPGT